MRARRGSLVAGGGGADDAKPHRHPSRELCSCPLHNPYICFHLHREIHRQLIQQGDYSLAFLTHVRHVQYLS